MQGLPDYTVRVKMAYFSPVKSDSVTSTLLICNAHRNAVHIMTAGKVGCLTMEKLKRQTLRQKPAIQVQNLSVPT